MMRAAVLMIALFLVPYSKAVAGGEKYHLTLHMSPTLEWIHFGKSASAAAYNSAWGSKLSYTVGAEYKRFFDPSLSFSIGVLYMNKGFRNEFYEFAPAGQSPQRSVTLASVHMVGVPLSLNIHHRIARKVEMIYTAGITGGYALSEQVRNKFFTGENEPSDIPVDLSPGKSNTNLFFDWYVGLHGGIGISAFVKSRVVLVIQPMYRKQLNDARDYLGQFDPNAPFTVKMNSLGLDLKIGYFFTKQIRNKKKDY